MTDIGSRRLPTRTAVALYPAPAHSALRATVPDVFAADPPDGLRRDTAVSDAVVRSAHDVAARFLWRLERGYC